jgi:hypothetical protein
MQKKKKTQKKIGCPVVGATRSWPHL